jgi:hypothetical protein
MQAGAFTPVGKSVDKLFMQLLVVTRGNQNALNVALDL